MMRIITPKRMRTKITITTAAMTTEIMERSFGKEVDTAVLEVVGGMVVSGSRQCICDIQKEP